MTQDTFNKLYTILLTAFFMGVFGYGLITGRQVPWEYIFSFIIPSFNHIVHQIVGAQIVTTAQKSASDVQVAKIQKNGVA